MRAVIISGGSIADYGYIRQQIRDGDTIICADSGYNHAVKLGVKPSIVVGDFDSIGEIPADVACLTYPARKDLTDTELAIAYAHDKGFEDFLILAGTGTRVDHGLTNILLLKGILASGGRGMVVDEHNKVMMTDSVLALEAPPGSIVSLVPIADCQGVTTENLEYPLENANMYVGKGLGVSNVMTKETATVSITAGLLLVIIAKD